MRRRRKVRSRTLDDGTPVHSFPTLMQDLQTIVRNTCRTPQSGGDAPSFEITTTATSAQKHALELLSQIKV